MNKISLGYNAVPPSAQKSILDVFQSGQFSPGPRVREFEEEWAKLHKAKHAIFVNSGTDALRLSLLALKEKYGWRDGDKVLVPALTFVATVNVILQAKLTPVLCDVGMHDYVINPYSFGHDSTCQEIAGDWESLKAVVPVHLFGQSCGSEIYDLAKKYKLKVLEDSCETILNPIRGDVSCYSTYMAHHVTTGVGGFAITNDEDLMLRMRSFANHGRHTEYLPGFKNQGVVNYAQLKIRFLFPRIGYSSRGTEFEAVLGLSQLKDLEDNVLKRQLAASLLSQGLSCFEELVLPKAIHSHTFMMFPIVLKEDSKIDKYDLCLHLEKNGIETRDMMPITNQVCYQHLVNEEDCYVARWINKKGFYMACHPGVTEEDIGFIQKTFKTFLTTKLQIA